MYLTTKPSSCSLLCRTPALGLPRVSAGRFYPWSFLQAQLALSLPQPCCCSPHNLCSNEVRIGQGQFPILPRPVRMYHRNTCKHAHAHIYTHAHTSTHNLTWLHMNVHKCTFRTRTYLCMHKLTWVAYNHTCAYASHVHTLNIHMCIRTSHVSTHMWAFTHP